MEAAECKSVALEYVKKYRILIIALLCGAFLMLMPDRPEQIQQVPVAEEREADLQTRLSVILSKIDGAGKVEVLLTESAGEQTYYQANENLSSSGQGKDQRRDTVLITNASREETGLIKRIDPPVYQGAVIICQGAENAQVRLSLVEAVSNATGLSTDKITVLKMK